MMARRAWALALLLVPPSAGLAAGGCAHAADARLARLARGSAYLCKHCNCYMPADVDQGAMCPVCKCGYPAHACHRER